MKKTLKNLNAGDTVFVVEQRRISHPLGGKSLETHTEPVLKVGKKYGYLSASWGGTPFCLETGHSVHKDAHNTRANGCGFDVYLDENEYKLFLFKGEQHRRLQRRIVSNMGFLIDLPLEALEKIHSILDEVDNG